MVIYINKTDGSTDRVEVKSIVIEALQDEEASRDRTILVEDNVMSETIRISTPGTYLRNEMEIDIEIPRRKG
jgi:hypothetical protein